MEKCSLQTVRINTPPNKHTHVVFPLTLHDPSHFIINFALSGHDRDLKDLPVSTTARCLKTRNSNFTDIR